MGVCCGACHVELKNDDLVVLDDLGIINTKQCYNYANYHSLDRYGGSIWIYKRRFPDFLISTYKQMIAMDEDEQRSPEEIEDEEVIAILANMFKE